MAKRREGTGASICEEAARVAYPGAKESAIRKIGRAIWDAARDGSLLHVFTLRDLLSAGENGGVALYVRGMRDVDRVAREAESRRRHVKMTLTIPADLRDRMRDYPGGEWSRVASDAFDAHMRRLDLEKHLTR